MAQDKTTKASSKPQRSKNNNTHNIENDPAWVWSHYVGELHQTKKESAALNELQNLIASKAAKATVEKSSNWTKTRSSHKDKSPTRNNSPVSKNRILIGGAAAAIFLATFVYTQNNEKYAAKNQTTNTSSEQSETKSIQIEPTQGSASSKSQSRLLIDSAIKSIEEANKIQRHPELDDVLRNLSLLQDNNLSRALINLKKAYQINHFPELQDAISQIEKIKN